MQLIAYIEIDCFALAILLLIFLNIRNGGARHLLGQKIFTALMAADALILIFDLLMWIMDGKPGLKVRIFYFLVTACYYTLNPVMCLIWYFYTDYHIYRSEKHLKKVLVPMLMPAFFNMCLSFASIFNDRLMFYLDDRNIYHRGPLFPVMALISFAYLVYPMTLVIMKRKRIQKSEFASLLMFVIPPLIGGIAQSLFYGISLIWTCATVSILIIFINIQNSQLYTDHLTGLYNRRQLDIYLQQKIQNIERETLAGIMIDLNSFKAINDEHGHAIGDQALQKVAEILKKTFRSKSDFIARYGGDEFIILITDVERRRLPEDIEKLKNQIRQFNEQEIFPFGLSLSIGYDYYLGGEEAGAKEFLKHIDGLMYQDKQNYTRS
jgi:diguanylate cyclase (GGDEF)-like protein